MPWKSFEFMRRIGIRVLNGRVRMAGFDSDDSVRKLSDKVEQGFCARYSRPPSCIVAAPGRVNLIGEHIDYNDGHCLPMAIERYIVIAAAPSADQSRATAEFYSASLDEAVTIPLETSEKSRSSGWTAFLEGVLSGFAKSGAVIPSFDAVIHSNIPRGAGLSSSAALEVGTATLLEVLTGTYLDPIQKVLLCQRAEQQFVGVPCGIMDQFSSVFGRPDELMLLDCRSQKSRAISFATTEISVLVTNSNVTHNLNSSEYALRRAQCGSALGKLNQESWREVTMDELASKRELLSPTEYRRARHVVAEIERTLAAAKAVEARCWSDLGGLMYESHESLRDDFDVSCRELDILVEIAHEIGPAGGVIGSRMTGGGFGGCTVSIVETGKVEEIMELIVSQYEARAGIRPSSFVSRPALGAHVLQE
jgi:galactokinase